MKAFIFSAVLGLASSAQASTYAPQVKVITLDEALKSRHVEMYSEKDGFSDYAFIRVEAKSGQTVTATISDEYQAHCEILNVVSTSGYASDIIVSFDINNLDDGFNFCDVKISGSALEAPKTVTLGFQVD